MAKYIRKKRCLACGEPHWFRYWVGENCASSRDGLCVVDFDLLFHQFRTVEDSLGTREVEHLMVVEVKTGDEKLTMAERDSLSVLNGTMSSVVPVNGTPINVKSRPGFIRNGEKKIQWHGVHLLRVPHAHSDYAMFVWDEKHTLDGSQLARVLDFSMDPNNPRRPLDTDRRHKRAKELPLFDLPNIGSTEA